MSDVLNRNPRTSMPPLRLPILAGVTMNITATTVYVSPPPGWESVLERLSSRLGYGGIRIQTGAPSARKTRFKSMTECHLRSLLAGLKKKHPQDYHITEQDVWWVWEGAWNNLLNEVRKSSAIDVQDG